MKCALCDVKHSPATPVAFNKSMGIVCCVRTKACARRQRRARDL